MYAMYMYKVILICKVESGIEMHLNIQTERTSENCNYRCNLPVRLHFPCIPSWNYNYELWLSLVESKIRIKLYKYITCCHLESAVIQY